MIIVVRAVFHENKKYYHQVSLDVCLYKLWMVLKWYIMIKLTFLKELILIKQMHQKNAIFVTFGIFQINDSSFNHKYAIDVMIY